ncbi:FAD/NAD(P)-binding protein [Sphingomonas bisphenolicum]|uniref:FAD/NAD(P)-binding protein n=1 Tax=Sphingomonas bisphenolicum TaxID=296544 RepID=UPI0036F2EB28
MRPKVAFVGSGPTAIYTLRALASDATEPFDLTIFEEQAYVGRGTPYRPDGTTRRCCRTSPASRYRRSRRR